MAKITIKELESLTAEDAGRILREDGNLAGRISVHKDGVSVNFFYRYRWGEQNKEYACATWPRKSLTDIRKARNQPKVTSKQVGDRQARFKNRNALSRRCHDNTLVLCRRSERRLDSA
jgi:ribosomal protein S30